MTKTTQQWIDDHKNAIHWEQEMIAERKQNEGTAQNHPDMGERFKASCRAQRCHQRQYGASNRQSNIEDVLIERATCGDDLALQYMEGVLAPYMD